MKLSTVLGWVAKGLIVYGVIGSIAIIRQNRKEEENEREEEKQK